jgi:hypothetical protein
MNYYVSGHVPSPRIVNNYKTQDCEKKYFDRYSGRGRGHTNP